MHHFRRLTSLRTRLWALVSSALGLVLLVRGLARQPTRLFARGGIIFVESVPGTHESFTIIQHECRSAPSRHRLPPFRSRFGLHSSFKQKASALAPQRAGDEGSPMEARHRHSHWKRLTTSVPTRPPPQRAPSWELHSPSLSRTPKSRQMKEHPLLS